MLASMVHVQLLGMAPLVRDLVASAVQRHPGVQLVDTAEPERAVTDVVITTNGSRASLDDCLALIGERARMRVYRVDAQLGSTALLALRHDQLGELTPDELIDHVLATQEQQ